MSRFDSGSNTECGTNTNTGDAETETCPESKAVELPRQPSIKLNGWTRKNLWPYCKYKKLYGERKFAQKYPNQPFRFLDLPAEIRNKIYYDHLYFGSIELSPEGNDISGNRRAVKHHMNIYRREITHRLRLLRVNKKINLEAASIVYGENEFRFSSVHGHDMLFAFCRTIGKRNTAFIRKIVEHAPWLGAYEDSRYYHDRPAHTNVTSWQNFKCLIGKMGLHEKGHGAWKFNIMRTLTRRDGGVAEYTMVLPDRFLLNQSHDFGTLHVNRSLLPCIKNDSDVQVSVVRLHSRGSFVQWVTDYETPQSFRKNLRDEALARGWRFEEANYDEFGNYELDTRRKFGNAKEPGSGVVNAQ